MNDDLSTPASSGPQKSVQELQAEVELLRKTLTATLFIMLVIACSFVFALRKQMGIVREDLVMIRPQLVQAMEQYEKNEKPQVKAFLINLQNYAKTHPDYAPIFSKYAQTPALASLIQEAVSAPAAAANPTAPTLK